MKLFLLTILIIRTKISAFENEPWRWLHKEWSVSKFIYYFENNQDSPNLVHLSYGIDLAKKWSSLQLWSIFVTQKLKKSHHSNRHCWLLAESHFLEKILTSRKRNKDIFILPNCNEIMPGNKAWEFLVAKEEPLLNRILCWNNFNKGGIDSLNRILRPSIYPFLVESSLEKSSSKRIMLEWNLMGTPVNVTFHMWKKLIDERNGSYLKSYQANDFPVFPLFDEFAKDFNITVRILEVPNGPGSHLQNGSWTGVFYLLEKGVAQISLTTNAPTSAVAKSFRINRLGGDSHARLFWRINPYQVNSSSFISVFSLNLWLTLAASMVFIIYFIRLYSQSNCTQSVLYLIGCLCGQGPNPLYNRNHPFAVAIFSLIILKFGWLFLQFYSSGLMAALASRVSIFPPNSLEELASSSYYRLAIIKGTRLQNIYFDSNDINLSKIKQRYGNGTICEIYECLEKICTGKIGLLMPKSLLNYPVVRKIIPCEIVPLGPRYFNSRAGIVMRKDFILADFLDWRSLQRLEFGLIYSLYFRNGFVKFVNSKEKDQNMEHVKIEQVLFPFMILGGGVFIAILVFVAEQLIKI